MTDTDTAFLAGGGELGRLMRAHDWAATPLGPAAHWPRSLKTVVRIMLTSRQPIWIGWGPQLTYLYNDAYQSIIGGKHPQALGLPVSAVWREIWGDIGPMLDSALRGDGTFVESQLLIMERNGYPEETYYTFSYSPIPGDDGQTAGIICANSDETQRVIGERQLALLREVASRAADARTVSVAVRQAVQALQTNRKDAPFALVALRQRGESAFGLAGATDDGSWLAGAPLTDLRAAPWCADEVVASLQPRLVGLPAGAAWPRGDWDEAPRQAMVLPIRATGDAGHEGVLVVGLSPHRLPEGRYADFLQLAVQQVSAAIGHAEAYEQQQRKADELAQLDRAKTQFFSNISHEFRTPLTLMMGPLQDVMDHDGLPIAVRAQLAMVERNALRLSKLVNALLEFSRIEAGRATSTFRPTDLAALTAELASNFRSAMERAGLTLQVDGPLPLPVPVYVDRDHWERIVLNLLSNALKYTLRGGVTVRVRADAQHAVVEVEDTGIGVAAHELPRLFERFHRIEGVQARTHEGSGIGLALVQELMRLHGGSIDVDSALGRGTRFALRLPLGHGHLPLEQVRHDAADGQRPGLAPSYVQEALGWLPGSDAQAAPAAAPAPAPASGLGERYRATVGARIVVADDNADMRHYVRGLLAPYYRVEEAADGEQALAAVRRERPALLLSDVMMPRLDGFGLLATLRADDALRTLPVILLSARAGEEARIEGLDAGADDYLVKPFTARELLARVAALIELDRLRRAGEQQLRLFLASAQMFTWDIDARTMRLTLSENAADVMGVSPANLETAFDLVHADDLQRFRGRIDVAVREGLAFTDEIRILRPDTGQERWLEVRAVPVRGDPADAGAVISVSGLTFDVTARKHLEQALRDADHRKDEFLAMLAHELRNPLAPIRNSAELMMRTTPPDTPARRTVEIISRQVRQMARMVDDLLDVSRITHGRIKLEQRPVDLSSVIAAAVEAVGPTVLERQHRLKVVSGLPLAVRGDAARLQQCVVNLLSNAAKYTDPGGDIGVQLARDGDEAVVSVQDSGAGIAPDVLPVVFDLFVQSARTLDRAQGGLGIGLSVVRRLIEMHGGRVGARSAGVGQGATFEFRLPLLPASTTVAEHRAEDMAAPPCRVLLIDDNEDAAESLALVLRADGHEVRTGFSAQDALDMAPAWLPQVLLLDIGLPGMDGYEVARRLRADPALAGVRLVALTGYGQPEDVQRSRQAGFDDHLVKPVDMATLAGAMRRAMPD